MTSEPSAAPRDAYRPFVPRRGRAMAWTAATVCVIAFAVVAFLIVPTGGEVGWTIPDKIMLFLLGCAIAALLTRWALVRADPTPEGLTVRNLFLTRFVPWTEVVNVQFGGGRAWCTLELDNTENLAVMAIQRADGPSANEEAARLAALVQVNQPTVPDN